MICFARTRQVRSLPRRQRGVALVVALILLIVATLIGLAASRGTVLQERMSANTYDRSLAFQRSEAALRAAEVAITADWRITNLGGVDCTVVACDVVPADAFDGTSATWIEVPTGPDGYDVNSDLTPGIPQYHITFMGTGRSESNLGQSDNADAGNYGGGAPPDNLAYYRVTARSSDPTDADSEGRATVVLQTTVKRAF
jgi:type IV pilus assembly protein PilX